MKYTLAAITLATLSTASLAEPRTYNEPYPYYKAQNRTGYQLYHPPGCSQYDQEGTKIIPICDDRDPKWIFYRRANGTSGGADPNGTTAPAK